MKTHLFAFVIATAATILPLAACQTASSTSAADRPADRQVYVSTQGINQRTVTIPENRSDVNSDRPYALRGDDTQTQRDSSSAASPADWASAHSTNRQ